MADNTYEKPQVKVFQSFTEVPTTSIGSQPAFIFGPEYTLFRYSEEHDLCLVTNDYGDAIPYTGEALEADYPTKSSVDTSWRGAAVYAENADYNTGKAVTVYSAGNISDLKIAGGYKIDPNGFYYKLMSSEITDALVAGQYLGDVADGGVVLAKYLNAGTDATPYKYVVRLGTVISTAAPTSVHVFYESYKLADSEYELTQTKVKINAPSSASGSLVAADRIYVQFRQQRTDHSEAIDHVTQISDVEKIVGQVDPSNPLAYGVYMAKLNSGDCPVYFLGTRGTTKEAFTDALRKVSLTKDIYSVVPMSDDQEVFDAVEAHLKEMSSEETKMWRIGWVSAPISKETYVPELEGKLLRVVESSDTPPSPPDEFPEHTQITLLDGSVEVILCPGTLSTDAFAGTDYYDGGWIKPAVSVTIGTEVTGIDSDVFTNCGSLRSVSIPSSVTSIGSGAFSGCASLTSITIPDSVTSIGNSAFSGCTSLTSVTIPSSVTSIGSGAFSDCTSLTSITIPSSVTSIGNSAFSVCTSLISITIPSSVTNIGSGAFNDCLAIATVYVSPGTIEDVKTMLGSSGMSSEEIERIQFIEQDFSALAVEPTRTLLSAQDTSSAAEPIPTRFPYFVTPEGNMDVTVKAQTTLHVGDTIVFYDDTTATVVSIPGNTRIEIDHTVSPDSGNTKTIKYVVHTYTGSQIAEQVMEKSEAFSNRRMYNTFPDTLHLTVNGEKQDVPGYFGAAACAGLCSSTLPQQPLTNMDIEGIHDVPETYSQFDNVELNVMASGGTFIIMQDLPYDRVYVRHQLSTATHEGNLLTRELSITKNVDSISYYLAETCDDLIGKYNITPELLRVVELRLRTAIDYLENNTDGGLYGPQLLEEGTEILSVAEHPVLKDHVRAYIVLNPPKPFNVLEIYLTVI